MPVFIKVHYHHRNLLYNKEMGH